MADDPQSRFESTLALDARVDSPGREGLTGTAPQDGFVHTREQQEISTGPDHQPLALQPSWRQDFPIDWPADQYVARRDFAKFLVLTSGAFVAGQGWIAAKSLLRAVFPLGMYTACTWRLSQTVAAESLVLIPRISIYFAIAAWSIALVGMLRVITRTLWR